MQEHTTIAGLRAAVRAARAAGGAIGLVPTMGYLHEGHLALCAAARRECSFVAASIFVNPLQFAPNEDFARYPRDLPRDLQLLREVGVDAVFAPTVQEMYPAPIETSVHVPALSATLEGATRPTHFQGVATVVLKLLQIAQPDTVYFGQKDGQQVAVVRRMLQDLSVPTALRVVPTVRAADGLALSSRNVYLDEAARREAVALHQALCAARGLLAAGERGTAALEEEMRARIARFPGVRLDYARAVDADTLAPMELASGRLLLAVAAYVGRARLIDNFMLEVTPQGVRDLLAPD